MNRPLLLFPEPEKVYRDKSRGFHPEIHKPTLTRQFNRLQPSFQKLQETFEKKRLVLQETMTGINPEYALVFEVIGNVGNFYKAVSKIDGLEWILDWEVNDIEPDEDFYSNDDSKRELNGRVYCIMSNQKAIQQVISAWKKYSEDKQYKFERGLGPLKEVFALLKNVRIWDASDRIYDTKVLEYWKESLQIDGNQFVPFEIELFYRKDKSKRDEIQQELRDIITDMEGEIVSSICIEEILYNAILVKLPREKIEQLVLNYKEVKLANVDNIMFFRPACQANFENTLSDIRSDRKFEVNKTNINEEPIIALFDGFPMQNHQQLKDRLIIDDPDEYEKFYQVKDRIHGTSMASLIIYGDLNRNDSALEEKLYIRPILKPNKSGDNYVDEVVPTDRLLVDLILRSVKRMIEGENNEEPIAPSVRIINLSLGDTSRQLGTSISPLARLLDWLSYKYDILFIISAGNQKSLSTIEEKFTIFKGKNISERSRIVFDLIQKNKSNYKILSPAESINNITVGALYDDFCNTFESERQIFGINRGLPSPISSFGLGYNRMIKPDLFYYGGRKLLIEDIARRQIKWLNNFYEPGCKVAAPNRNGDLDGIAYTWGTSDATAQITHEAGKCYEILKEIFMQDNVNFPQEYIAVLIKAMLTHGASWDNVKEFLSSYVEETDKKLFRWLGNGIPDIEKVKECAKNRVTLIGMGSLNVDNAHVYNLPLPFNFANKTMRKRLTVTLAYISPTNSAKQAYRQTQLWFDVENLEKFYMERQNTEWQKVKKGTLQHEIFESEKAGIWDENDELKIKINCREDADKNKDAVKYALFVTFEVAPEEELEIYEKVKNKMKQLVVI